MIKQQREEEQMKKIMQEDNWLASYYDLIHKEEKLKKQQAKMPVKGAKNKLAHNEDSRAAMPTLMPLSGSIDISDIK